jgi:hypothetical protein
MQWYQMPTFKKWLKARFYLPVLFVFFKRLFSKKNLMVAKNIIVRHKKRVIFYVSFAVLLIIATNVFNYVEENILSNAFWQARPNVSAVGGYDFDGQQRIYLQTGTIYGFKNSEGEKMYNVVLDDAFHIPLNFYHTLLFFNNVSDAEKAGFKPYNTRAELLEELTNSLFSAFDSSDWEGRGLTAEEFLDTILEGRVARE